MVRSAATPRVSNHAAMDGGHDSAEAEYALANCRFTTRMDQ
jgi:hypothetical protein